MNPIRTRRLSSDAEVRRIEMLYEYVPVSVVAALIGIVLCCIVLFGIISLEILKAWAAFMLSVAAGRVWLWHMFGKADVRSSLSPRWEWMFAAGAVLSGLGWGALFGPLYPPPLHPDAQMFMLLSVVVIAFTGAVFLALSHISFWLFTLPVVLPAFAQYLLGMGLGGQAKWTMIAATGCIAVLIAVQIKLNRSNTVNLERTAKTESLLAEQEAIFESSPIGIAVIDDERIVKCNGRLAELLGQRMQDLTESSLHEHFLNAQEAAHFFDDRSSAFDKGHLAQGLYRLRRANGTELWGEFSGRKMADGQTHSVWMIADATERVASDRRAPPRGKASAPSPKH
ncbi:MAG: PAS domain S-box protein [Sulfuritalea sp.]|nr:PAS domain S-box protein [Sulfuritalea sp.]